MKIKGHTISDAPNIIFQLDPNHTGYFGYQGAYYRAVCPICGERYYYNQQYYPVSPPPTCGRYECLRVRFINA